MYTLPDMYYKLHDAHQTIQNSLPAGGTSLIDKPDEGRGRMPFDPPLFTHKLLTVLNLGYNIRVNCCSHVV